MPATPAWPPGSTPRLFIDQMLGEGICIRLDGNAAHYLISVMRIKAGDTVLLFDGENGEWAATAQDVRKRDLVLCCQQQNRALEQVPDFWLCAAPVKRGKIDLIVEKACELGVARILPVLTRRSVVDRLNSDRLRAHMIEAAEQCGRTALPELSELTRLESLLLDWPDDRHLFFADENGGAPAAATIAAHPGPAAFLIGPEGGFDPQERAMISAHPGAIPLSLGPRILRAETAAIAATALWMGIAGDWASSSPD